MKYVHLTPAGIIYEEDGTLKLDRFSDDLAEAGKRFYELMDGKYMPESLNKLREEREFIITSFPLKTLLDNKGFKNYRLESRDIETSELLVRVGYARSKEEALEKIRIIMKFFTLEKLKKELANKDLLIIHAINTYDEYTETINLFYERLREWYGIYFPELINYVSKIESYANLVATICKKEDFTIDRLESLGYSRERARLIHEAAEKTGGALITKDDLEQIRRHALLLKELIKHREALEKYLKELLTETAPNLTAILGYKLAARLIAKAGGLLKLASSPASTIQLLGAEKALFIALRKKGKPPKHGIIFQHPFISQSPRVVRGKIARLMAGRLAIAARVDAFGGEFIGDKLYKELREKVNKLRKEAPIILRRKKARRMRRGKR